MNIISKETIIVKLVNRLRGKYKFEDEKYVQKIGINTT